MTYRSLKDERVLALCTERKNFRRFELYSQRVLDIEPLRSYMRLL